MSDPKRQQRAYSSEDGMMWWPAEAAVGAAALRVSTVQDPMIGVIMATCDRMHAHLRWHWLRSRWWLTAAEVPLWPFNEEP